MISAEKVISNKVVELIKIYHFYFGHFFIGESSSNIIHKIYISLLEFMKLREMYSIGHLKKTKKVATKGIRTRDAESGKFWLHH
jgi:hypothetical protein